MFSATITKLLSLRVMQDPHLTPSCRALYQAMLAYKRTTAQKYTSAFHMPFGTVRRCLAQLNRYEWLKSHHDRTERHLIYSPWMPIAVEREVISLFEQSVDNAANRGEFIMKAMLDMVVNDPHYIDNARLRWTRLGTKYRRLEFDRYYPDALVAVEFQGRQHFEEVEFQGQKSDLETQQVRDGLKALACLRQQVTMIEIADVELSFDIIIGKLTPHMSVLPPPMNSPFIQTIANLAHDYTNWARERRTRNNK